MSEQTTLPDGDKAAEAEKPHEETIPYEKWQATNNKAKEATEKSKAMAKQIADLQAQVEEREQAGLPELERFKKDLEKAQKRADDAEAKAAETETKLQRTQKERWVTAAAQAQNFADPSDAAAFVALDEIESEKDAEREVKRLASSKKHLVKAEDPVLPGRVLENGRAANPQQAGESNINFSEEARMLAEGLKPFATRE